MRISRFTTGILSYSHLAQNSIRDIIILDGAKADGQPKPKSFGPGPVSMITLESIKVFRKVFDAVSDGIAIFDKDGTVVIYNRAAGKLFNKKPDKMMGRFIGDIFPSAWEGLSGILETGEPQIGKRLILEGFEIVASRNPIFDGDTIIGVISIFQDASAYEKALTELHFCTLLFLKKLIKNNRLLIWHDLCGSYGILIQNQLKS